MVGLDAAGKTTILYKLKLGEGEFLLMPLSVTTAVLQFDDCDLFLGFLTC